MRSWAAASLMAAAVLCGGRAEASPILLSNGDFESGSFAGWTTFITANGSPFNGPTVSTFDIDAGGPLASSFAAHFDVGQANFVPGVEEGGGIFRMFSSAAGTIHIAAGIASQNASGTDNDSAGLFRLLIDGVLVGSFDFGDIAANTTETSSLFADVAVAAGSHELRFLITRPAFPGNPQQFIDNVTIDQTALAPVPEPATLALMSVGLAVLAVHRARGNRVPGSRR